MQPETITRLRNAFAQVVLDWLCAAAPGQATAASALPFSSITEADWREAVRLWRQHAEALLAGMPRRGCPACGGDRSRVLFVSYDAHWFDECDRCGCWFAPGNVTPELFDRFFARCPEAGQLARRMMEGRDRGAARDADLARIGGYLDELLPLLPDSGAPPAYLDIGCGVGHSLRAGLERGLRVQGVEVDRTAVALARAGGVPIAGADDAVPPGPYHLVSFWETLEHIADPLAALERYLPLLAEDGLVAITVPNLNALATRALRESCPWIHGGYNTPGHINMFHAPALERLLSRAGLTLLDADGQFSANPIELAAVFSGATRGAFDHLDGQPPRGVIPERANDLLQAAWPGAALVERLSLLSPILAVIACRRGREGGFAAAIAERRRRRHGEMRDVAVALLSDETDYKRVSAQLQEEIDRREAEAVEITSHLQAEIDRREAEANRMRSQLQAEIDRRDAEAYRTLVETTDRLQSEINLRDALLDDARRRFERTAEGRIVSGVDLMRRAAKRMFTRS